MAILTSIPLDFNVFAKLTMLFLTPFIEDDILPVTSITMAISIFFLAVLSL